MSDDDLKPLQAYLEGLGSGAIIAAFYVTFWGSMAHVTVSFVGLLLMVLAYGIEHRRRIREITNR